MNITTNCLSCDLNGKAACAVICANCMHNNPAGKYNLHQPVLHTILMVNAEGKVRKFEGVYRTDATIWSIMLIDSNGNELARFPIEESWAMIDLTPTMGWNKNATATVPEPPQNAGDMPRQEAETELIRARAYSNGYDIGTCAIYAPTGLITAIDWACHPMSKVLQGSNLEVETKDGRFPIKWDPDQQSYYIVSSDGPQKAAPSQETGNTALADAISMGFMDKVGKKPV